MCNYFCVLVSLFYRMVFGKFKSDSIPLLKSPSVAPTVLRMNTQLLDRHKVSCPGYLCGFISCHLHFFAFSTITTLPFFPQGLCAHCTLHLECSISLCHSPSYQCPEAPASEAAPGPFHESFPFQRGSPSYHMSSILLLYSILYFSGTVCMRDRQTDTERLSV